MHWVRSIVSNTLFKSIITIVYLLMCFLLMLLFTGCQDNVTDNPGLEYGSVTDIDGNVYVTVKIGNQWWMAENLRVTSFSNGEKIPRVEDNTSWATTSEPACAAYNNGNAGSGLLYNYFTVKSDKGLAPAGWRISTDEDWKILEEYVGMPVSELDKTNWRGTDEGDQLKEETSVNSGWFPFGLVWGTNSTGFNATGGSCRVFNGEWGVPGLRFSGYWWTSTGSNEYGWFRYLDYQKSGIFRYNAERQYGFSVRCVKIQ